MITINSVVIIGRLTRDPELRYTQSGTAVTRFTLAVDKGYSKDKKHEIESQGKPTTDFINITVWGKMAENSANYLVKGRLVGVSGRIQTSSYKDDNGQTKWYTDVVANQVEFLEFGNKENNQEYEGFDSVYDDNIPF